MGRSCDCSFQSNAAAPQSHVCKAPNPLPSLGQRRQAGAFGGSREETALSRAPGKHPQPEPEAAAATYPNRRVFPLSGASRRRAGAAAEHQAAPKRQQSSHHNGLPSPGLVSKNLDKVFQASKANVLRLFTPRTSSGVTSGQNPRRASRETLGDLRAEGTSR